MLKKITSSYIVLMLIISAFVGITIVTTTEIVRADPPGWWDANWTYRELLTINESFVDANITNATLLIYKSSDGGLANYAQPDGDDIVFVSYNDNSTQLPHEIEYFNPDTGELVAHVKINLYNNSDTKLWMYYKNDGATDTQDLTTLWSDYVVVYHGTDRNSTTIEDFTGTPWHNGTKSGSILPAEVAGKIFKSQDFEAGSWAPIGSPTATLINAPDDDELTFGDGADDSPFSFSIWLNPESLAVAGQGYVHYIFNKYDDFGPGTETEYGFYMYTGTDVNSQGYNFALNDASNGFSLRTRAFAGASQYYNINQWHFITGTYSGNEAPTGMIIYHNTTNITTAYYDNVNYVAMENKGSPLYVGGWYYNSYSRMDGLIDEFRLIGKEWNASEVKVNYHSQNNSNGFITFGSPELKSGGSNPPIVSNEYPSIYSTDQQILPLLEITLNDPDGDTMNLTWQTNATGSWSTFATNNSINNGTYRQYNSNLNKYYTKYWWKVLTNDGNQWNNYTFYFTTENITTLVDPISPYNITTSPLTINVTGSSDLDKVSLYYRYSIDNSTFNVSNIGATFEQALFKYHGEDPNLYLNYPNSAVVRDNGTGILMYIATYTSQRLQIIDVTNPSHYIVLDDIGVSTAHDVKLIEYSNYGLVAYVISFTADMVYSFNVTNPNNIVAMDSIGGAGSPNYLDLGMYLTIDEDKQVLYATGGNDDSIVAINISNPNNLILLDEMHGAEAHLNQPWSSVLNGDYLYVLSIFSPYQGITIFDVSDPSNISYVKNISGTFNYLQYKDGDYYYATNSTKYSLVIWDISDPLNWSLLSDTYMNCAGPVWIDYHYAFISPYNQYGFVFADISNKTNPVKLMVNSTYLPGTHWLQVHYNPYINKTVFYTVTYISGALGIINVTYNYTKGGFMLWNNATNPDTTYPWQWNFTFPNGTGYYEFVSVGNWSGIPNETLPDYGDAICQYSPILNQPPDQPTNEIPANNSDYIIPETYMNVTVSDPDADNMTVEFRWQTIIPWDNDMRYNSTIASQNDSVTPFIIESADDFYFEKDTVINGVSWIGMYWQSGYNTSHFNWTIGFYKDTGNNYTPENIPFYQSTFNNSEYTETFIENFTKGDTYACYNYSVTTENLIFLANQKYWVSIQGIGLYPPQSGIGVHQYTKKLKEIVFRSALFGFPNWTNVSVLSPKSGDMCFQLLYTPHNNSLIATIYNVTNNSVASIYLPDYQLISHDSDYSWYVVVDDGTTNTTGPTWNFNTSKAWDLNGDRTVNYLDASLLIGTYGSSGTPGWITSDINNDGVVNYLDASLLVGHYGESY